MNRRQANLRSNLAEKKETGENSKKSIIYRIIFGVLAIVSVSVIVELAIINMLPKKYLWLLIAFVVILNIASFMFLWRKKTKTKAKNIFSVFAGLFALVMGIVFVYCLKTYGFLSNMNLGTGYKEQNYSVIVLKDSKYSKIGDLKDKIIEYYNNDLEGTSESVDKLKTKVEATLVGNEDLTSMANDLLEGKTDAILVEDSYKTLLEEEVEKFTDKTKVIYTFKVRVSVEAISKEIEVGTEPFSIYISGIDTYGEISSVSRSDVNIVVTVNPNTHQVLLINVPRDYYVQLSGTTGSKDKLTHAGIYGIEKSVKTIEDLLDMDINYYVKVNFTSLIDIVNAIGGITVYSEYTFTSYIDNYLFKKGYNEMNGSQALAFARERKSFETGDRQRGANQQAVIEGIIRKASTPGIITKFNSLLKSLDGKFQTNMSTDKILELVKLQIDKMPKWNVISYGLTGSDSSQITYSGGSQRLYVMVPSSASVEGAKNMVNSVLNGEKLDSTYGEVKDVVKPVVTTPPVYETYNPVVIEEPEKPEEPEEPVRTESITQEEPETNTEPNVNIYSEQGE